MKQAGWSKKDAFDHLTEVGWHGIDKEPGGMQEIQNTVNSAFANNYTYSYKNEIIAKNMTQEESQLIQAAYTAVAKEKKDTDKVRFSNYEQEILVRYPYLRKNEIGIVFNYDHGVYRMMSDLEISNIILNGLYDDMLWGYRTQRCVSDKVACLLSIIPDLNLTNDLGWVLNLKNGLLNIYTRELKPHTPTFVSLVQSPVEYDPSAKCPIWLGCVRDWMEGPEVEKKSLLLQQFSGYCLSSSMQYDKALFLVGDGGNGKSTFVDTISRVIGQDATSHIDLEGLYGQYGMKGLIGKRLNIIEEVHGNYYQSNKLKKLISGEPVTIDIKYKDQFSFRPQTKFIFAVNIMPRVDDTSTATERRICAIQFLNNFRNNPNTQLRSDRGLLGGELPGILNWMLDGAKNLSESVGFVVTHEQISMLSEYRQENSSVEGFISEVIEKDEDAEVTVRDLYEEYKTYCIKDGRKFKGAISFVKEMRAYAQRYGGFGYLDRSSGHTLASFKGIKIFNEWNRNQMINRQFNKM
jgi:putative DNA primase/helicase